MIRNIHTGRTGLEGDVKMVLAGQAALDDLAQHPADHRAQRLLDDFVIRNQAIGGIIAHLY